MFKKWCSRILLEIMGFWNSFWVRIVAVLAILLAVLAIVLATLCISLYAIVLPVYGLFSLIRGGKHVRVD